MSGFTELDLQRLRTCDPLLQTVLGEARDIVPFMVLEGFRDKKGQDAAFKAGRTQLKWPNGKHNGRPSLAVDVAPIYFDATSKKRAIDWDDLIAFGRIMGCIQAIAFRRDVKLRFGLDWDGDFRSVNRDSDESLLDAPHIELVR